MAFPPKLDDYYAAQENHYFYKTQMFIVVSTKVRHWILSWARWL